MSSDFGSILFKPTCSNCGSVIRCDVHSMGIKNMSDINYQAISPNVCPYCGCSFETIKIPLATNDDYFTYSDDIYETMKGSV